MVGLKVLGLAAGTKLYLMLDDESFFIRRASSKDGDLQSELNASVEICLVDSGSKTQEISRGDGEGTGIIYANFSRAGRLPRRRDHAHHFTRYHMTAMIFYFSG